MKWFKGLRKQIIMMLGCSLLIAVLIGINAYEATNRLVQTNNWVVHTHLVMQHNERIQARLINLNDDLRGHVLSSYAYFRTDFNRNVTGIRQDLRRIRQLTKDNVNQQKRLAQFDELFRASIQLSDPFFTGRATNDHLARLDSVKQFLDLNDQAQVVLKAVGKEEEELLTVRVNESKGLARYIIISSLIGAVIICGIILWAVIVLFQSLKVRTKLNRTLKENDKQLRQILDAIPMAVGVIDSESQNIYYTNKAACEFFDVEAGSTKIKPINAYRYPGGEVYPAEERPLHKAIRDKVRYTDDMEFRLANGEHLYSSYTAQPILDEQGELRYVVLSFTDITDQLRSQERLREAKELAEKASVVKEHFMANMSHEIRTPLNAIIGFSGLLETTELNKEQKEYVHAVRISGKNLLTIINDILDLSKIEAEMLQFETIPFSIYSLADSVRTMLQATADDKKVGLNVQIDPAIPAVVLGDPMRLTQVLINLISNAIKFTEKGEVSVEVSALKTDGEQVLTKFAVRDTGIGIALDMLPHIFERFRQESGFTTRRYGGSGLGLNIVKSLVEMQGGSVHVESEPGKGSLFVAELTYAIAHHVHEETLLPGASKPLASHQSVDVLVVEDNPMNQKLATAVLTQLGYSSVIANNGEEALAILENKSFDIILMDLQMPVMDGYETTRQIRTRLKNEVPIIAMTAHALKGEREQCLQVGMNDFVPKPFQIEELQRAIRSHLPVIGTAPVLPVGESVGQKEAVAVTSSFNLDYLRSIVGDDTEAMADLLESFLEQTPGTLADWRQALERQDLPAVKRLAHFLKAPAQMMGLEEVSRLCKKTEELVVNNEPITVIEPLVNQCLAVFDHELPIMYETLHNLKQPNGV